MVFNEFSKFGGSKLASFSFVFRVSVSRSFFDCLAVDLGVDLASIWAPKWMSRGLPVASGSAFQRKPRINRSFVPFGSLKTRFEDPSWEPFGCHDGFQNVSF